MTEEATRVSSVLKSQLVSGFSLVRDYYHFNCVYVVIKIL